MVDGMEPESWLAYNSLLGDNPIIPTGTEYVSSFEANQGCGHGQPLSYRYWSLVRDPMVDGMVPESWFENSSLMID